MTDHKNTTDPAFADYRELATTDPDKALDLLVWLFMDAEVAAERYAFLAAMDSLANDLDLPSPADFESELKAIRELGVFHAVKDGGIELMRLCAMASVPDLLVAAYETFSEESAPWMLAPIRPRRRVFGRTVTVITTLQGASEAADARPVLPDGDPFGPSPDRRSFLIRCDAELLQNVCPYRVVVAKCDLADGTRTTLPVVVTQNTATGKFEGSVPASQLLGGKRAEFGNGDKLDAVSVTTAAEILELGLTIRDIENLLATDPVAKNSSRVKDALEKLIIEMESADTPPTGNNE